MALVSGYSMKTSIQFYTSHFYRPQRSWGKVTPPPTRYTPRGQVHPHTRYTPRPGTPPGTRYTPRDQVHPPPLPPPGSCACWEIRATSGRYASYWNAFLLSVSVSFSVILSVNTPLQTQTLPRRNLW